MQGNPATHTHTSANVQVNYTKSIVNYNTLGYCIIALPIIVLISIIAHKKYRVIRHQRRIAFLEKMWLLDMRSRKR
jgi:hypothetical protein